MIVDAFIPILIFTNIYWKKWKWSEKITEYIHISFKNKAWYIFKKNKQERKEWHHFCLILKKWWKYLYRIRIYEEVRTRTNKKKNYYRFITLASGGGSQHMRKESVFNRVLHNKGKTP